MTTERYIDDKPDLEARRRPSKLLQALSPELASGSDWPEARAGDFIITHEDGCEELVPRVPGVTMQPVAFVTKFMEWPAERGARTAPIDEHDFAPLDTEWIDVGGRKACMRMSAGTRIEKTIFAHALVDGFKTTFAFKSTAYDAGERLGRDADKVRVEVDGETVRVCGALYRLTSELERKQGYTWYGPRYTKLGILGEANGPTIEQVRLARDLRFEFKAEEEKRKAERAALSAVKPTPALTRGTISITSGIERPRLWADPRPAEIVDPKPAAQPDKTVDPKLNDGLDDLPF